MNCTNFVHNEKRYIDAVSPNELLTNISEGNIAGKRLRGRPRTNINVWQWTSDAAVVSRVEKEHVQERGGDLKKGDEIAFRNW